MPDNFGADIHLLLARANAKSVVGANRVLDPLGLRVRPYSVLALAAGDEPLSQRDLAARLSLDPSQVVSLVDDLEQRGLVTRAPRPTDRRINVLSITAAGRELLRSAELALEDADPRLDDLFTPAELEQLTAMLARIAFAGP